MSDTHLSLLTETTDGVAVIRVTGELDLSTVEVFDAELEQSLPLGRVVIEMSECTFLDSSALRSLVRGQHRLSDAGGQLALVAPSQPARRALEITTLDRFTPVFDTLAEAVTSLA